MTGSVTNECILCQRPTPDGYCCPSCASVAAQNLARVVEYTPDARAASYGLLRGSQGGASGKPGSRSPGNDGAIVVLWEIENTLGTWARHVYEERGAEAAVTPADPIVLAARYLAEHVEWWRHRAEVDEAFGDFEACARRLRSIVDGPPPKKYLGPCGYLPEVDVTELADGFRPVRVAPQPCEGDVYGVAGARTGSCRTCGAQVDQGERRAWLDDQVRDKAFRLSHIADAYGLKLKTLRDWATDRPEVRAENGVVIRSAKPPKLWPHGTDRQGKQLFLVGAVLDLAAEAAAKRAENEARRNRQEIAA